MHQCHGRGNQQGTPWAAQSQDLFLLGGCQAGCQAQADRVSGATQALLDAGFRLQKRSCVADEHYVPTLLAVHGLDNQVSTIPCCRRNASFSLSTSKGSL